MTDPSSPTGAASPSEELPINAKSVQSIVITRTNDGPSKVLERKISVIESPAQVIRSVRDFDEKAPIHTVDGTTTIVRIRKRSVCESQSITEKETEESSEQISDRQENYDDQVQASTSTTVLPTKSLSKSSAILPPKKARLDRIESEAGNSESVQARTSVIQTREHLVVPRASAAAARKVSSDFEALSPVSGTSSESTLRKKNGRSPKCAQCQNHGVIVMLKGHKRYCPWRLCECQRCIITLDRRKAMASQVAIRRAQAQDEARARELQVGDGLNLPSTSATSYASSALLEKQGNSHSETIDSKNSTARLPLAHPPRPPTPPSLLAVDQNSNTTSDSLQIHVASKSLLQARKPAISTVPTLHVDHRNYSMPHLAVLRPSGMFPAGGPGPSSSLRLERWPTGTVIRNGGVPKLMNLEYSIRSTIAPMNLPGAVQLNPDFGLRRTEISASEEEAVQALLEVFRLPPEADFLVYRILKDCGGDFKLASSKIFEAQCEFRSLEMVRERERLQARVGMQPFFPPQGRVCYYHPGIINETSLVPTGRTTRSSLHERTDPHSSSSNANDVENRARADKSPTADPTKKFYHS